MIRRGGRVTGATVDSDRVVAEVVIAVGFDAPWAARVNLHLLKGVPEWAVMRVLRVRIVRQDLETSAVGRVVRVPLDLRAPVVETIVAEARAAMAKAEENGATIGVVRVLAVSVTPAPGRRIAVLTSAPTSMSPSTPRMRASPRWRRPSVAHAGRSSCSTSPRR